MKRPISQVAQVNPSDSHPIKHNPTGMSFFDSNKQGKSSTNLEALMHALGNLNKPQYQRPSRSSRLSRPGNSSSRSSRTSRNAVEEEDGSAHLSTFDMERWQGEPKKRQVVSGGGFWGRHRGHQQRQHAREDSSCTVTTTDTTQSSSRSVTSNVSSSSRGTQATGAATAVSSASNASSASRSNESQTQKSDQAQSAQAWRTATCPTSGKTYYWNIYTRESRWKKPMELATPAERNAIQTREKEQKDFFAEMEANILKKWQNTANSAGAGAAGTANAAAVATVAAVTPEGGHKRSGSCHSVGSVGSGSTGSFRSGTPNSPGSMSYQEERDDKVPPLVKPSKLQRLKSGTKPIIDKPKLIRTISKMEYDLANQLRAPNGMTAALGISPAVSQNDGAMHSSPNSASTPGSDMLGEYGCPGLPFSEILSSLNLAIMPDEVMHSSSMSPPLTPSSTVSELSNVSESSPHSARSAGASPRSDLAKPCLTKRNTCGTIYLGSTLSAPDKDALIKCVCGVFRAHLLQSSSEQASAPFSPRSSSKNAQVFNDNLKAIARYNPNAYSLPTLEDITSFYRDIFLRSQMEVDCIIISLIYVERLIKKTEGRVRPNIRNWRSVLFSCMVLSSKVWDDLSMWNCDFSKIGPSGVTFSLQRTNELEVALLSHLDYSVKVNASEYAKYYFILRSMLCRSGLASDSITSLNPLDVKSAKGLEKGVGCSGGSIPKPLMKRRSKSYNDVEKKEGDVKSETRSDGKSPQSPNSKKVSLEHLVRM